MFLEVKYFRGGLESYCKEREKSGEVRPTIMQRIKWLDNWRIGQNSGLPEILLPIPEWGVRGMQVQDDSSCTVISLLADDSEALSKLAESSSSELAERIVCKYNGSVGFLKPTTFSESHLLRTPHFLTSGGHLQNLVIEGPNTNGHVMFTSKITFEYKE